MAWVQDLLIVSELDAIKTLSDPLRLKILEILIDHAATSKQVSTSLGLSCANVHYHVKELEKQGLIRLIDTVEKGGILEKYYRAVASNYYIDRTLGKNDPGRKTAVEAYNREIMRRRLSDDLQVNLEQLCDRVVNYCLNIQPGEVIQIIGGFHQQELIEMLYMAMVRIGARPVVAINSDAMWLAPVQSNPDRQPTLPASPLYNWLKDTQVVVSLDQLVNPDLYSGLSVETIDALARDERVTHARIQELGIRHLCIGFPTRVQAEAHHLTYADLYDAFWKGLNVDYAELRSFGRKLRDRIHKAQTIRITGPFTDLSIKLAGRSPLVDDGVISSNDLSAGHNYADLPAGEVFVAPLEGSAEGKALFHSASCHGELLRNILMEFKGGEVVHVSGEREEDAAMVRELLFLPVEDDRRKLCEFAVGFNPAITEPLGFPALDHRTFGSIHIALGGNDMFGGESVSSITWSFVLLGCRVELDGEAFLDKGKFFLD